MIHGGLNLNFKLSPTMAQECCLRNEYKSVEISTNFWNSEKFRPLRELNISNQWSPGCHSCQRLESAGLPSFRTGSNEGLGIYEKTNLSGPARIDLMFDISCNLACRSCGPWSSTFWQKHLKENQMWDKPIFTPRNKEEVIDALSKLDLSNLKMLVFCGGETLMGQEYWDVAEWLVDNIPDAKNNLTLCFQTNGTQPVHPRNFQTIEKCFLVKLHVSLDGIEDQFEYLRWPAKWDDVVENLMNLRKDLPSNVMFLIEETISIFNLKTMSRLDQWVQQNFQTNREGDVVNHTRHMAHGFFKLYALTDDYVKSLPLNALKLVPHDFKENPSIIKSALNEIQKFDLIRNQSFDKTFPEVAQYYSKFR